MIIVLITILSSAPVLQWIWRNVVVVVVRNTNPSRVNLTWMNWEFCCGNLELFLTLQLLNMKYYFFSSKVQRSTHGLSSGLSSKHQAGLNPLSLRSSLEDYRLSPFISSSHQFLNNASVPLSPNSFIKLTLKMICVSKIEEWRCSLTWVEGRMLDGDMRGTCHFQ